MPQCLPRNLHIKLHIAQACHPVTEALPKTTSEWQWQRQKAAFARYFPKCRKQNTCPKFTTHCTCHEIRACQRPPPSPKICHEICASKQKNGSDILHLLRKVGLRPPKHKVAPLHLPRKMTTKPEQCAAHHGTTTRAQSRNSPAPDQRFVQASADERHFEDLEGHDCSVTSECAGHDEHP